MKILFTRFPLESVFGGAEVQVLSLMEGLRSRGHDVSFVGSCPILLSQCKARGIRYEELSIGPPPVTKWNAISFLWRKNVMNEELKACLPDRRVQSPKLKADAVIMLSLTEKLLLTGHLHDNNVKVFWLEHDRVGRWLTKNPWLRLLKKTATMATTIVVSELSKKLYLALGWKNEHIVAIPNGIDLDRFASMQSINNEGRPFTVGCVARLSSEKGVDVLIEAVSEIPEAHTRIIGIGREEGYLRTLITERGLEGRISIEKKAEDIEEVYRAIDILVLPSRDHDPFGLTAAEAMILGIPVVVTDACGIAGYLTNGEDAMVVDAESHRALAGAIKTLLHSKEFREKIGAAGRITAHNKFGLDTMIDAYEHLLSEE